MRTEWNKYEVSARHAADVATSDTVDLPTLSVIVCTTTGNCALVTKDNVVVTFTGVPAGYIFPILAKRINSTNTTGTYARLW